MGTKIKVSLTITGHFNPDDVSKNLGLCPTRSWRAGESIQRTFLTYKNDGWQFSIAEAETLDLEKQLTKLLNAIQPNIPNIINICNALNLDAEIACAIDVEEDQYPMLHISQGTIKLISTLNADFDIDIV